MCAFVVGIISVFLMGHFVLVSTGPRSDYLQAQLIKLSIFGVHTLIYLQHSQRDPSHPPVPPFLYNEQVRQ